MKCFHPTGTFVEFKAKDVEQSMPQRFERIVGALPDRIAVKSLGEALTYGALNKAANPIAHAILAVHGNIQRQSSCCSTKVQRGCQLFSEH